MTYPRDVDVLHLPTTRRRRSRAPLYLTLLAAVLVLAAGGVLILVAATPDGGHPLNYLGAGDFRIRGQVELRAGGFGSFERNEVYRDGRSFPGGECWSSAGDLKGGAQVTITDEAGQVIALGQLGTGQVEGDVCVLRFELRAPYGHPFYGVEVAKRGVVRYSAEEIRRDLRLG